VNCEISIIQSINQPIKKSTNQPSCAITCAKATVIEKGYGGQSKSANQQINK
jgi:hypothetical protein